MLGQAQFAELLQAVLQDLVQALSAKHVVVIQDIKLSNGSKLRKVVYSPILSIWNLQTTHAVWENKGQ